MIPEPVRLQVGTEIHQLLMAAELTGRTKEENAWQLIRLLTPYIKPISNHSLAVIHISALLKLVAAERHYGFPKGGIHIRKQMHRDNVGPECPFRLTTDEWTNFGKLRYWALAVHATKENRRSGFWRVTDRGHDFLAGRVPVSKRLFSWNRHYYPGPEQVWVTNYRKELPDFETFQNYVRPQRRPVEQKERLPIFSAQ